MALTYTEADLFLRAGDDMRWSDWPESIFVRLCKSDTEIDGFKSMPYTPSHDELNGNKWRKA